VARPLSPETRASALRALAAGELDLLVVGGGITGAGIARDGARRGLATGLVEAVDFAAGTSSRSSKLIHGGLRYLQQFELKLVFEGTSERAVQMAVAPHLVRPIPFLVPVYRGQGSWLGTIDAGLWLYDALALFRVPHIHRTYRRKRALALEPGLEPDALRHEHVNAATRQFARRPASTRRPPRSCWHRRGHIRHRPRRGRRGNA
jgi:glycerol-3-phosphate dehydrogenase